MDIRRVSRQGRRQPPSPRRSLAGSGPACQNVVVRTSPLIGKKAWFGPRRLGWGLAPVSPEGWAVAAAGVMVAMAVSKRGAGRATRLSVLAALLVIVVLKGTAPGGPLARRVFEEARRG
jgi:hypothetical protein